MSNDDEQAAPLYVWIFAVAIVSCITLGMLLFAGSVDKLINLID